MLSSFQDVLRHQTDDRLVGAQGNALRRNEPGLNGDRYEEETRYEKDVGDPLPRWVFSGAPATVRRSARDDPRDRRAGRGVFLEGAPRHLRQCLDGFVARTVKGRLQYRYRIGPNSRLRARRSMRSRPRSDRVRVVIAAGMTERKSSSR